MVQGVGGTGSSGSISNLTEYQVYYPMYQRYIKANNSNLSFESWLIKEGYLVNFNQKVENYIETGNSEVGDGSQGNTINAHRHLSNGSGAIFQSEDEDCYYEFDYDSGTYRKIEGNEAVAKALGIPDGNNIDTIKFGYNSAVITDYTFGNLDDGQDSKTYALAGKYGGVTYVNQEFDIHYILNALLMDPSDPQYQIAKAAFDDLCANTSQWLPQSDLDELDAIALQYGTNSLEYKSKLQEVLLKNLDQANEWVEEHSHVKNPNTGSLTETGQTEGSTSTDGTNNSTTEEEGSIPSYDKNSAMNSAGVLDDYTQGTWTSRKISWKNDAGKDTDKCREMAKSEAVAYATSVLDQLESSLASQMGEEYTEEIQQYLAKAKTTALGNTDAWLSTDWHKAMLGKNRGYTATCNTKVLIDNFFKEFDSLCQNKGKTTEEVEAEKKAAEEKAAKEEAAYKDLYNTNMVSVGTEAGVNKDIQVVNVNSAAEIKAKAESDILDPIKNKIISKYSGQIPASDLQTMLDNAANAALTDCTEWATTSNNYVYTIDADKLISTFDENIKTLIKNKGYNF